jgi:hypothetical protein
MYTVKNFKTKKALRDALAKGEKIEVYQPGPFNRDPPRDGEVSLEGPHFPQPHTWYARVTLKDGYVVKVK